MLLFQADGILAVIFSYVQMISIFLVLFCMEAVIAAKSKTMLPGLAFLGMVFLLAVFVGVYFKDFVYFLYMLAPVGLCLIGFLVARYTRKRNLEKGARYNEDGALDDDSML